ncbi:MULTISPECIES: hypothetical protein [unclassified Leptolyngbya]|uniref:hypothetical protein n=1 Tax=unclassified Leptolyngbya TaxID=2650499 RepID=UPI001686BD2B|nr:MULTISPECIES: hypothetical protein [unclassified Leptolyngbya]MBD1912860.1 hypothetical protein [Leptolyngbya sp. FACHB-8]MBD2153969.1 hypothetical protein [Leptolyngbya sp. FACHB-16]
MRFLGAGEKRGLMARAIALKSPSRWTKLAMAYGTIQCHDPTRVCTKFNKRGSFLRATERSLVLLAIALLELFVFQTTFSTILFEG